MTTRRRFLTHGARAGAATLATPAVVRAQDAIKWRMQTMPAPPWASMW